MSGRPARRTAAHQPAPVLHPGTLRPGWCPACKAWTHITADLLLLTPTGVTSVGALAWCEICDDFENPLPARRIDRAGP